MKITNTLIQKFLDNQCTVAEAEAVGRYLQQYPDLAATYLRSSWEAADAAHELPAGYKEAMLEAINTRIGKQKRVVRFRWAAAAASLLIGTTAVWLFRPDVKAPPQHVAAKSAKQPATLVSWKVQNNTTGKSYRFKLEDGSVVKLAPKAVIRYQVPFTAQDQRTIYMEGEAEFDVARNKQKPFTVHTKLFSTTALGTSFRVSEKNSSCYVRLYHGKVLIRSLLTHLKGWKKDVVLTPGNELKYSVSAGVVSIVPFKAETKATVVRESKATIVQSEDRLLFDNTPLPEVMKTLTDRYHTTIFYEEEQLKGKFFSGEVLPTDSLSVLLHVIANMNDLQVTKKEDVYIITQSK